MQSGSLGRRMRVRVRSGEGGDEALLDMSELGGKGVLTAGKSLRAQRKVRESLAASLARHAPAARARREDGRDYTPLGTCVVSAGCAGSLLCFPASMPSR